MRRETNGLFYDERFDEERLDALHRAIVMTHGVPLGDHEITRRFRTPEGATEEVGAGERPTVGSTLRGARIKIGETLDVRFDYTRATPDGILLYNLNAHIVYTGPPGRKEVQDRVMGALRGFYGKDVLRFEGEMR